MIKQDIQQQIISTLKEHKTLEVTVLRFLLSQIKYAEIEKQKELTDEEIQALFVKEVKKRKESIEMYAKAGRTDLVDEEKNQLTVIEHFLPKQMTEEEVIKKIKTILDGIEDTSNQGRIIGTVMAQLKGKADGSLVARIVKEELSKG